MTNEEIRNNEEMENTVNFVEQPVERAEPEYTGYERSSNGKKFGIGGVLFGLGVAGFLAYKNRDKLNLNERRARKLEKKGYVVFRPDEDTCKEEVDGADCGCTAEEIKDENKK